MLRIFLLFLLIIPLYLQAQSANDRQLSGQVVELTNGRETGVPKLTVSIPDFAWDITDDHGFFKLRLPAGRDFVTLTLEQTPLKILSPYEGLVNLPPEAPFRLIVCGEENRRLTQKVAELNDRIGRLEKDKRFSSRQLAGMHKTLLDTILHYEIRIGAMAESLQKSEQLSAEVQARAARIGALEDTVQVLVQALSAKLEERFLHQKEQYDRISSELMEYADRLKDLRDRATPDQLPLFFRNQQAADELNGAISRYNETRAKILDHYKGNILVVRQFWENRDVSIHLESTYQYLLNHVHQECVLPLDARVFGEIRKLAAYQTGRPKAQKKAEQSAAELLPRLNTAIGTLEKEITTTLNTLDINI